MEQADSFARLDAVVNDMKCPLYRGTLSQDRMAAMDAHARACPTSVTRTIADLATYLASAARSPEEKVRAICFWLHLNVRYDTEAYFGGTVRSMTADDVLRDRCTVCHGFSRLMAALCKACNVECEVISGYAKGMGFTRSLSGTTVTASSGMKYEANHNWNAVKLYVPSRRKERWHLVDPTWCAGHTNGTTYIQEWGRQYYMADPLAFVQSHFPENPAWTLLPEDYRLSWQTFTRVVKLRFPVCWELGVLPISHKQLVIQDTSTSDEGLRIVFKVKKGTHMLASFTNSNQKFYPATLSSTNGHGNSNLYAFTIKNVSRGGAGAVLNIFASHQPYGTFSHVTEYVIA
ncbi:hypothetical protein Agub_g12419 [Astrephomene gubernaculifera]|uniref:Transglutaminase-like domain-containing protein n=1 Tax=Astrephomene gubernaculifera TaxID=47775 RepID=A0AAD3HRH0_9CHLO|nr:hypothetical protein Agub_g12405 [Astrephomene gubernaculifera]GFR50235.1 hypothetical protein Agub_g12419 [Astrephomene gubernaculifera]